MHTQVITPTNVCGVLRYKTELWKSGGRTLLVGQFERAALSMLLNNQRLPSNKSSVTI
jgi:hypothetical protein